MVYRRQGFPGSPVGAGSHHSFSRIWATSPGPATRRPKPLTLASVTRCGHIPPSEAPGSPASPPCRLPTGCLIPPPPDRTSSTGSSRGGTRGSSGARDVTSSTMPAAGTSTGAGARSRSTWATGSPRSRPRSGSRRGRLGYVNGTAFTHDPVEELAAELARVSPGELELVYPLGSGSEAVEAALKLARQYWVELGRGDKAEGGRAGALLPRQHAARAVRVRPAALQRAVRRMAGGGGPGSGTLPLPVCVQGQSAVLSRLQRCGRRGGDRPRRARTRVAARDRGAGRRLLHRGVGAAAGLLAAGAGDLRPATTCCSSPMRC